MPEINLDQISEQSVDLEPRVTKGAHFVAGGDETLKGRITVGTPLVIPVTADTTKKDTLLGAFMKANPTGYKFHALRFACTLNVVNGEPFNWATLSVLMERKNDPDASPAPIAWQLEPCKLSIPVTYTQKVDVGADLTIPPFWKFSISPEQMTSWPQDEIYLQALGIQESTPKWHFEKTSRVALGGSYPLIATVITPADTSVQCEVQFDAEIERMKFGLIRYSAALPPAVASFVIP